MSYVWVDPKDFEPKTRLYADDLDEIVNDLYYLRNLIVSLWPIGVAIQYPCAGALPSNFLECDGTVYANTSWPALAAVIGNTWGGVAGASFAVPDYRGRAPIGAGQGVGLTNRALGTLLGVETHVLTLAQVAAHEHGHTHAFATGDQSQTHWHGGGGHWHNLASHTHNFDHWHSAHIANVKYMGNSVAHNHGGGAGVAAEAPSPNDGFAGAVAVNVVGTGAGGTGGPSNNASGGPSGGTDAADRGHTHSGTTGGASAHSQGGNAAFPIMQPSAVTRYIIRAA